MQEEKWIAEASDHVANAIDIMVRNEGLTKMQATVQVMSVCINILAELEGCTREQAIIKFMAVCINLIGEREVLE